MNFTRRALGALPLAAALPAVALAQDATEFRIGAPLALSGGLAEEGRKQAAAYELFMERITAAGGITLGGRKLPVKLVTYDYQTDGARAQQLAERLITEDRVHAMTAPFGSGHAKIVATVAERHQMPIVAVASAEPVHDTGNKYLFGTLAPSMGLIDILLDHIAAKRPETRRIVVIGRDDVFPKAMAAGMADRAAKRGLQVVQNDLYPVGTLDHSSLVARARSNNPDWLFVTGYTQDLVLFRKQMADVGLAPQVVTMITGPAYREFTEALGPLAENISSVTWWHPAVPYRGDDVFGTSEAFTRAVVAKTGKDPDYVHASSAAALIALTKAAEKAGTLRPQALRDALAALDISTFYGPIRFREDGMNNNRDLPIIQVQDGQPKVLHPAPLAQASIRFGVRR